MAYNTYTPTTCQSMPSEYHQVSYHEFVGACELWTIWNGTDYGMAGMGSYTHVDASGTQVLGSRAYAVDYSGQQEDAALLGDAAFVIGQGYSYTPTTTYNVWLEATSGTGNIMLVRRTLGVSDVYIDGKSAIWPYHGHLLVVWNKNLYPGLAKSWRVFDAEANTVSTAQALHPSAPQSGDSIGVPLLARTLLAGNSALFVLAAEPGFYLARACLDGSASDAAWKTILMDGTAKNPGHQVKAWDAIWDGQRLAVGWWDHRYSGEGYLDFALFDINGNLIAPPARFLLPTDSQGNSLSIWSPKVASDGNMYLLTWIAVPPSSNPLVSYPAKYYIQRFDHDGNPVGCQLTKQPPPIDYGIGTDRVIAPPGWISYDGSEWVGNFCTVLGGNPYGAPEYGSLWRFTLGLPP